MGRKAKHAKVVVHPTSMTEAEFKALKKEYQLYAYRQGITAKQLRLPLEKVAGQR